MRSELLFLPLTTSHRFRRLLVVWRNRDGTGETWSGPHRCKIDCQSDATPSQHPLSGFTVPELTGRWWTARDLGQNEDTIWSPIIGAVTSGSVQDLTLEPAVGAALLATGALPPLRFHCSARVTFGPLLVYPPTAVQTDRIGHETAGGSMS